MTGRTHVAAGVATALALAAGLGGGTSVPTLACAATGGALGAVLPDLDVRNAARPLQDRMARIAAATLLASAIGIDAAGWPLVRHATGAGLGEVALGVAALVALCCAMRLSAHRSFSHSLLALAGVFVATRLACAPLAPFVAAGMASHLALDLLTYRGLRLFWPARRGLSLRLFHSGGIVDEYCLVVAAIVAGYAVCLALVRTLL